jgi:hypothetical protein
MNYSMNVKFVKEKKEITTHDSSHVSFMRDMVVKFCFLT